MGRRPDGDVARTRQVMVRLTEAGMEQVDRLRAKRGEARSAYLRRLLAEDVKRNPK